MSLSSSVSFRQGANVEFAGPAFVSTGDGKSGQDEVRLINFVILKNWKCAIIQTINYLGQFIHKFGSQTVVLIR